MAEIISYKNLTLITADFANAIGLAAESPVWVSPQVRMSKPCDVEDCKTVYTPITYQAGKIIRSQHYHPNHGRGGIYFYDALKRPASPNKAAAFLTTTRRVSLDGSGATYIAPFVRVDAIKMACIGRNLGMNNPARCGSDCPPSWLDEGVLVKNQGSELFSAHDMTAAKRLKQMGYEVTKLGFRSLTNGSLVFTQEA